MTPTLAEPRFKFVGDVTLPEVLAVTCHGDTDPLEDDPPPGFNAPGGFVVGAAKRLSGSARRPMISAADARTRFDRDAGAGGSTGFTGAGAGAGTRAAGFPGGVIPETFNLPGFFVVGLLIFIFL
jgi:hypothetical protein